MKHIYILLFTVAHYLPLAAQTVFPAAADQPVWHLTEQGMGGAIQATAYVSRDTFVCGHIWNVAQQYFTAANGQNSTVWTIGYYRVEGDQVFFRSSLVCTDPEYLMYDFSLEVGDTALCGQVFGGFSTSAARVSIYQKDTITIDCTPRRRLWVWGFRPAGNPTGPSNCMQWIEGVGSVEHPIYSGTCFSLCDGLCESTYWVSCFKTISGAPWGVANASCFDENRFYVHAAATGANNGRTWQNAFRDLQDAIALAAPGDTILVAQGTYFPTDGTNREKHFLLKNGVVILGGFNATECLTAQRDPVLYETILSGDIGIPGDSTDNSFHVLFTLGTDSTTVLDGFTITRGQAIHPDGGAYSGHLDKGGGLYVGTIATLPHANPRIRNCRFIRNVGKNGGAIYCDGTADGRSADPILENCTFEYNRAPSAGGAIYKKGISHPERAFNIRNCNFGYNRSAQVGGAIYFFDAGNTNILSNTQFYRNKAVSSGGAIFYETSFESSFTQIVDCIFEENDGRSAGALFMAYLGSHPLNEENNHLLQIMGAVFEKNYGYNASGGAIIVLNEAFNRSVACLSYSTFEENYSIYEGGGIYFANASGSVGILEVDHCRFHNNHSQLGVASCIYMRGEQSPNMTPIKSTFSTKNTLFSNNDGAIALLSGVNGAADGLIRNCTFYKNGEFPIIKNWGSNFNYTTFYNRMEIANSIIWEPEAIPGRLFYNNSLANPSLHDYNLHHNLISAPDCDLPGGDVACGAGNIFATWPAFLDTLNGDFRVAACSPAINAGTNESLEGILTDLDGNPRILDSLVDMGAYERHAYRIDSVAVAAVSCPSGNDGNIFMGLTGNAPYHYAWQTATGQTGEGYENLPAGNYHFSVTDAVGCSDTISVVLSQPEAIEASFVVANASAFNVADGSILLDQINGGTPPYRFFWSTGDTSASLSGLAPGLYELAILDANDCEHLLNFEVSFINATNTPNGNWQLQVSPNPIQVGQQLRIWQNGNAAPEVMISVWDAQGRPIQEFFMNGQEKHLDTEKLPAGVYWLRWQGADGRSGGLKVVVL